MADQATDYLSAVNGVIRICKDAEEGFRGAASAVNDASLKRLFEEYSSQRASFASQLRTVVQESGNEPADPSGIAGTLHHGWIALKGVLTGQSEHQILEETERGEDLSVKHYREALSKSLPPQLQSILETQYQEVKRAHDRIKSLRNQTDRSSLGNAAGSL
ncbi:MAG: PA2169 family four-helix-bundle protein [Acidobacteriota bacterium]|nr:PA2169 family four-helix-bundle protein [Acidobacteriota bacterium]